jgi:hypothetical protein
VQRGRGESQTAGSMRTTSTSTSITRGGSPTPGVSSLQAPLSSPGVVRQSSAVRPISSISATRQASAGSASPGSTTPTPLAGSFQNCVGNIGEDVPLNSRALSPPHVAAVAAAAAAAVKSGTMRHTMGGTRPGTSTPQPSRYAYVNSVARRDPPQTSQRDARRRGRV